MFFFSLGSTKLTLMGTGSSSSGSKLHWACSWPLTCKWCTN